MRAMIIPSLEYVGLRANVQTSNTNAGNGDTTQRQFSSQWTNPSDVLSVLLIVGGEIVQKALAQTSGGYFTPVCFSFGWVAYSLSMVVSIVGDGRLLPDPDHPVKVYNLKNGFVRENKNWIIGRILRDNVMRLNKNVPIGGNAIRIAIYDAQKHDADPGIAGTGRLRLLSIAVMLVQFGIAAIPYPLYGEWGILLITGAGTLLALVAGALPQWRVEKHPEQTRSKKNFALSSGNGSRDIMIIRGLEGCIDLEELAAPKQVRSSRVWESHPLVSKPLTVDGEIAQHDNGTEWRKAYEWQGIPLGFWITIVVSATQFVLWLALLISVAGLRAHVWYLLLVGAIGMLQNVLVAASSQSLKKRNLKLRQTEVIITRKVMDGLMDLEIAHKGFGEALRNEFFPGKLKGKEIQWWNGETEPYDTKREMEANRRGLPRKYLPRYSESATTLAEKVEPNVEPRIKKLSPRLRNLSFPSTIHERSESQEDDADAILPAPSNNFSKRFGKSDDGQNVVREPGHVATVRDSVGSTESTLFSLPRTDMGMSSIAYKR